MQAIGFLGFIRAVFLSQAILLPGKPIRVKTETNGIPGAAVLTRP